MYLFIFRYMFGE